MPRFISIIGGICLLLPSLLLAQPVPTSFLFKDTPSPNQKYVVHYDPKSDRAEITDASGHPVLLLCETVFNNGRNSGQAFWNEDSSSALLFMDWNRESSLTVAKFNGKQWTLLPDPFEASKPPFSNRGADIKSVRYLPVGWSKKDVFSVKVSVLFRDGSTENYACSVLISPTSSKVTDWKKLP